MRLDRAWIAARIPHAGRMCLLDEVLEWSAERIRCRSGTHRDPENPLRREGRLGAACAVEYAAQAIAVHGALLAESAPRDAGGAGSRPQIGYLASIRDLHLRVARIDDVAEDLICEATRLAGDGASALYSFTVGRECAGAAPSLVSGRATIVIDGDARGASR